MSSPYQPVRPGDQSTVTDPAGLHAATSPWLSLTCTAAPV